MSVASVASYIWGQCTQLVAQTLDWVPPGWGNANQWVGRASAAGYPTGHTPHVGDVAVWPAGYAGAHNLGHVAAVQNIIPPGRGTSAGINVREQNWSGGVGVVDTRFVPDATLAGLTFISPKGTQQSSSSTFGIGNPLDAVGGAIDNLTKTVAGGAVNVGLYGSFFVLAIVLIIVALLVMGLSTNVGRSAAKGAMLAV